MTLIDMCEDGKKGEKELRKVKMIEVTI
jgi:hypothetical protein